MSWTLACLVICTYIFSVVVRIILGPGTRQEVLGHPREDEGTKEKWSPVEVRSH